MIQQHEKLDLVDQPYRRNVLTALLSITIVSSFLFSIRNFLNGHMDIALAEVILSLFAIFVLLLNHRGFSLPVLSLVYSFSLFSIISFALTTIENSASLFVWVFVIPLLSYWLLGRFHGFLSSSFFLCIALLIFCFKYFHYPHLFHITSISNMLVLVLVMWALSHVYEVSRERSDAELLRAVKTDFLTGLSNRIALQEFFDREVKRSQREGSALSFLMIDLDYFKGINDQFGHDVGDRVLIHVAKVLANRLRDTDLLARLGGEEFAVLLLNVGSEEAQAVADSLREAVQVKALSYGNEEIHCTISVGVAQFGPDGMSLQSIMAAADRRLYLGKERGRNQVVGSSSRVAAKLTGAST